MPKPEDKPPVEPRSRVRMLSISADQAGQRIDNFLLGQLKGVPKSRVYRILRKGEVRVNKGRVKPEYRLRSGDQVRVPPVRIDACPETPKPGQRVLQGVARSVLFEDDHLLVLNKPSGLAVHGGSGLSYGAIEALRVLRDDLDYLELVHRLDRDTSGCLMVAKRRQALRALHTQLRDHQIGKTYLALLKGRWPARAERVRQPLRKNMLRSGERIVRVDPEGKSARTDFEPLHLGGTASLARVTLHSGRTHQIRVHSAWAGHPVAGDPKYGDEAFNARMVELGLKRLFLHASRLVFRHPGSAKVVEIQAPLDEQLQAVLDRLGFHTG